MAVIRATNRTQRLVLGFFLFVWAALVAILIAAPGVYDAALKLGPGGPDLAGLVFLLAISILIAVLGIAILMRWRWAFWLILIAFLFGIVRVATSALQLAGVLPSSSPSWYVTLQGIIGVAQFLIALAMIAGYRKAGAWGAY